MTASEVAGGELPEWLRGERARPSLPALAGASGALVVLAGMFLLLEEVEAEDLRAFGLAVSGFTLLVGCVLMFVERRGALRTAGVALAGGAVLPLALALVNDPAEVDSRTDVLVTGLVAVVVWLLLFLLSPGRGHGLFLGLALLVAWFAVLVQTTPQNALLWFNPMFAADRGSSSVEVETVPPPSIEFREPPTVTFTIPTMPERTFREPIVPQPVPAPELRQVEPSFPPFPTFSEPEQQEQQEEQPTSLGRTTLVAQSEERPQPPIAPAVVSILFGLAYLLLAALLDQVRLGRLAGACTAVGVPVLAVGVVLVGPRHGGTAVSVAALAFGLVLLAVGVGGGRRFSGWTGAAVLAGGALGLIGEAFDDPGSGDAVAMLLVGAALVAAGWFLASSSPTPAGGAHPRAHLRDGLP